MLADLRREHHSTMLTRSLVPFPGDQPELQRIVESLTAEPAHRAAD